MHLWRPQKKPNFMSPFPPLPYLSLDTNFFLQRIDQLPYSIEADYGFNQF